MVERKKREKRGIFVAGRMEGRGDKAGLKVGVCHGRQPENKVMTFTVTDETATENCPLFRGRNLIFNRRGL